MKRTTPVSLARCLQCAFILVPVIAFSVRECKGEEPSLQTVQRIGWNELEGDGNIKAFVFEVYGQWGRSEEVVDRDFHIIGRASVNSDGISFEEFPRPSAGKEKEKKEKKEASASRDLPLLPTGLVQMLFPDLAGLGADFYDWQYKGEEIVGDIRCWLFDLKPKQQNVIGAFTGRVSVSVSDQQIIRFDGSYSHDARKKSPYLHFITSRVKVGPSAWVPASVYVEDRDAAHGVKGSPTLRCRISAWGYQPAAEAATAGAVIHVAPGQYVSVADAPSEMPEPHIWDLQIEKSVITWMEAHGLLAVPGQIDNAIQTVIDRLLRGSETRYRWPIKVRLLLSAPLEIFTIGDTVVVSKGVADLLRDDTEIATAVAPAVARILLGQHIDRRIGFHDLFLHPENQVLKELTFQRTPQENAEVEPLATQLLAKSDFHTRLANAGQFLRDVSDYCLKLPALFKPEFGNALPACDPSLPMTRVRGAAPLNGKTEGGPALGARVSVNPSTDTTELMDPVKEKLPFRLTSSIPIPRDTHLEQGTGPDLPPAPRVRRPALPALK